MAVFPGWSGSLASNPLHYMVEPCSALQGSWIPGPLFGRGRDAFPKTVLTFERSTIPSSSAGKKPHFLQWWPFQKARKGWRMGTQEEETTTLRCESHPAVERATVFQKLIQTFITIAQKNGITDDYEQNNWHFWMHTVPSLPSFPKPLFSSHLNSHAIFHSTECAQYWMPWANMIQYNRRNVFNTVHVKTSADTVWWQLSFFMYY